MLGPVMNMVRLAKSAAELGFVSAGPPSLLRVKSVKGIVTVVHLPPVWNDPVDFHGE